MFISRKRLEYIKAEAKSEGRSESYREQERREMYGEIEQLKLQVNRLEGRLEVLEAGKKTIVGPALDIQAWAKQLYPTVNEKESTTGNPVTDSRILLAKER